ncbi:hypothetical protein ABIE26_003617 [Pedobacter africanus]|uniref:hypothetical protein n=1 Tax=Pedobacter africanus TaxID=151894 RepID=UPI00339B8708
MSLFQRKKKPLSQRQDAIAQKVAGKILQSQRQLAKYLNERTAGLSGKTWLVLLIAFCAAFSSYLLYLLMQIGY